MRFYYNLDFSQHFLLAGFPEAHLADKRQMQEMVKLLLGLEQRPKPDDAADALAVAICHLHSSRYQSLIE